LGRLPEAEGLPAQVAARHLRDLATNVARRRWGLRGDRRRGQAPRRVPRRLAEPAREFKHPYGL